MIISKAGFSPDIVISPFNDFPTCCSLQMTLTEDTPNRDREGPSPPPTSQATVRSDHEYGG